MKKLKNLTLKNNVRSIRVVKNITQEELANMCNVSRQTIIAIEKGNFCPTAKLAALICIALEKNFEEIFYLE